MPTVAEAYALAFQYREAGNLPVAEQLCRQIIQASPSHSGAHHLLGLLAYQAGSADVAIASIRRALALNPSAAEYHSNLGLAFMAQGRLEEALASYEQALRLQPGFAGAHANLGNGLLCQGKQEEAVAHYEQALRIQPDHAEAHCNLGVVLACQGQVEPALEHWRHAVRINPEYPEAHNNLSHALHNQGKQVEAVWHAQQALRARPGFAEAHNNLANALLSQGRLEEAATQCRHALSIRPDYAEAHYNLGIALRDLGMLEETVDSYRRALHFKPHFPAAFNNLGDVYLKLGLRDDAMKSFQEALRQQPDALTAQRNVLFCLNYDPKADPDEVFVQHCRWGELMCEVRGAICDVGGMSLNVAPRSSHVAPADSERRLRIGYVSPDLRLHALARYLEPVLANHDPEKIEVFCYAEVLIEDAVTDRLRRLAHHWRITCSMSDRQLAQQIRDDKIDILVDLAGHTCGSRLSVFALKPAPLQATWLGYLNTTGLKSVDYRLTDDVLDPPGQPVRDTEELVRLPVGMCCFAPPSDAPNVSDLPALSRRQLTFGSLHNLFKLNDGVFDLWSAVLEALPTARLLMYRDALTPKAQERIRGHFVQRGISSDRLELRRGSVGPGYLKIYDEIDVGLDTFPCTGGVTTCESLWMGVPVLTLRGIRPVGRNSAALLARVGLGDWAVDSLKDYVSNAVTMTRDRDQLALLRAGLRKRMLGTLCDGAKFTRGLEQTYRIMWRRWCAKTREEESDVRGPRSDVASNSSENGHRITDGRHTVPSQEAVRHFNQGLTHLAGARISEALPCFQCAVELQPDFVEAHVNLASALMERREFASAAKHYREAIKHRLDYAEAHSGLGVALADLGDLNDAVTHFREALRIRPDLAEVHVNLATALEHQGQWANAARHFSEALRLRPDFPEAQKGDALRLLRHGDFERGWPAYEARWKLPQVPCRSFLQPLWAGSRLDGKTILLFAEQGLGDTLQFIRYAPLVKDRGGNVIVECQSPLWRILAGVPGVDRLVAQGSPVPSFDVQAPLLSLPRILGTSVSSIPATVPYLHADAKLVDFWRHSMGEIRHSKCGLPSAELKDMDLNSHSALRTPHFLVGIAWQGNPAYRGDRYRSISLDQFSRLAEVPGVQLISLQKGSGTEQMPKRCEVLSAKCEVEDESGSSLRTMHTALRTPALDEASGAFMDAAAIMKGVDLIICSDSAIAHLAGALATPVWVALPFGADWRWLLERDDSPWYPTMRLFRQTRCGRWDDVFERIATELKQRMKEEG